MEFRSNNHKFKQGSKRKYRDVHVITKKLELSQTKAIPLRVERIGKLYEDIPLQGGSGKTEGAVYIIQQFLAGSSDLIYFSNLITTYIVITTEKN